MKVNCKALKLSICISGIFLILSIISKIVDVKIGIDLTSFIKDIMLGIFCSSIVTVFFYISAYKVERKKVLEKYWNEIRRILIELKKIDYMNIHFEEQVFIKFIKEQKNKVWLKQYYKQISRLIPEEAFENTNLIKNKIAEEKNEILKEISMDSREKYLEEEIEKIYNRTTDRIDKIVNQYLKYLEHSTDNLNFILGDIEFFTGKKNYKKAQELFERIYDLNIKIQESARHFRYYIDREGNKAFVLSEILKVQKEIFEVEETEDSKIIYSKFIDSMEIKLEEFRANIIYNIEPEKIAIIPLMEVFKLPMGK